MIRLFKLPLGLAVAACALFTVPAFAQNVALPAPAAAALSSAVTSVSWSASIAAFFTAGLPIVGAIWAWLWARRARMAQMLGALTNAAGAGKAAALAQGLDPTNRAAWPVMLDAAIGYMRDHYAESLQAFGVDTPKLTSMTGAALGKLIGPTAAPLLTLAETEAAPVVHELGGEAVAKLDALIDAKLPGIADKVVDALRGLPGLTVVARAGAALAEADGPALIAALAARNGLVATPMPVPEVTPMPAPAPQPTPAAA